MAVVLLLVCTPCLSAQDSCAQVLKVIWKESESKDLRTFMACYGDEFDVMMLGGWLSVADDARLDTATFGMLRVVLDSLRSTTSYAWLKEEIEKERQELKEREANRPPPLCDPPLYAELSKPWEELPWYYNFNQALACAQKLDRPMFVFFAGFVVTNSAYMREKVFTDDSVSALLAEKFVPVTLYTDGVSQQCLENKALLKERFNEEALPYLVIISPDNRVITKYDGMMRTPEFLQFLNDGLKRIIDP